MDEQKNFLDYDGLVRYDSKSKDYIDNTINTKLDGITESSDNVSFTQNLTSGTQIGTLTINGTDTKLYAPTNTDTKNTAGSTNSFSKLFLIGATSQAENPQTYSHDITYIGDDGHLYSNGIQTVNLSDSQELTNKTYNGYTLAAACEKGVSDSSSASAISTGTNLVTERDVYYGLPKINNSHSYTSITSIYAPTAGGTSGYVLVGNGITSAPKWTQTLPIANGGTGATNASDALTNLGIVAASFTGTEDGTIILSSGTITKCPLSKTPDEVSYNTDYFEINSDGGIVLLKSGYYMICGSVYIEQTSVSGMFSKGCYIIDENDNELCSSTEVCYTTNMAGAVSVAPKMMYFQNSTILYLCGRSQKTTGNLFPGNTSTYLTIVRLGN